MRRKCETPEDRHFACFSDALCGKPNAAWALDASPGRVTAIRKPAQSPAAGGYRLQALDEGEGLGELGELGFFGFELAGVHAAADTAQFDGVLEVKHLVVEEIFEGVAGAGGTVEDAADHDGVVGGVVVAEGALGQVLAPGELRAAEEAREEADVEGVEDLIEVVVAALGAKVALAAAGVADELGLAGDGGRGGEALVAEVLGGADGLLVELGEENVGDGADHGLRRAFQEIGEVDIDLAFAEADGGVERGKAAEADRDGRHGRARAEGPVLFLEDGDEVGGHQHGG